MVDNGSEEIKGLVRYKLIDRKVDCACELQTFKDMEEGDLKESVRRIAKWGALGDGNEIIVRTGVEGVELGGVD